MRLSKSFFKYLGIRSLPNIDFTETESENMIFFWKPNQISISISLNLPENIESNKKFFKI